MKNTSVNSQLFEIFIIIAETIESWQYPDTDEGKKVLMEHYQWGAALKAQNKLILAGPLDFELTSTNMNNAVGHDTGLIVLNVYDRSEAIEWAEKDPFHQHGFRKNKVHSLKISMTNQNIFESLQKTIQQL
jgi:uncharacterized protein YciI